MRSISFVFVLLLCLVSCQSDKSDANLLISGNIKGLKKGKLYLQKLADTSLVNLDSVELYGSGEFKLDHNLDEPTLLYLYLDKKDGNPLNDRLPVFAEAGSIRVTTSWNAFSTDAKVVGSAQHKLFEQYSQMLSEFNKKELNLVQQEIKAQAAQDSLGLDSLFTQRTSLIKQKYRYVLTFAMAHPESAVSPYVVLKDAPESNPVFIDSILNKMPDSVRQSQYAKELEKLVQ